MNGGYVKFNGFGSLYYKNEADDELKNYIFSCVTLTILEFTAQWLQDLPLIRHWITNMALMM